MEALLLVLGIPLAGGLVLALSATATRARDVNVAFSLGTFVAACVLTARVIADGPMLRAGSGSSSSTPLNVFLVALTAFVGADDRDLLAARTCASSATTAR